MTTLAISGPIGYRQFHLEKKCETNVGHTHNYDHAMFVIRGRLKVIYSYMKDGVLVEGETREYGQGDVVTIKADVHHTVKALEDDTVYHCVFSHRDFDGLVTQTYKGNSKAYV